MRGVALHGKPVQGGVARDVLSTILYPLCGTQVTGGAPGLFIMNLAVGQRCVILQQLPR